MANTYVNKVQLADGTSLIDISDTTATADKILTGYTAYGADGSKLTGTASAGGSVTQDANGFIVLPTTGGGGGSGLEYEEGVFEPSVDIDSPTINFLNSHTVPPFYIMMVDSTGTYDSTLNSMYCFIFTDHYRICGNGIYQSSSAIHYNSILIRYRGAYSTAFSYDSKSCFYNSDNTGDSSSSYSRYYAKPSCFVPYYSGNYWRAGRTYKWIAVWAPTT